MFENDRKVSFNIASKASYVSILSGQKFINNTKNSRFGEFFENLELAVKHCYQTGQIGEKKEFLNFAKEKKIEIFGPLFFLPYL